MNIYYRKKKIINGAAPSKMPYQKYFAPLQIDAGQEAIFKKEIIRLMLGSDFFTTLEEKMGPIFELVKSRNPRVEHIKLENWYGYIDGKCAFDVAGEAKNTYGYYESIYVIRFEI